MFTFIIICIVAGLLLTVVIAPIIMASNHKYLKEMDREINKFESATFASDAEKDKARQLLKKELVRIKGKIVSDKHAVQQAADKIAIV